MAFWLRESTNVKSIRGVPTHVVELPASSPQNETPPTVLVVPGSPGAGQLYLPFARRVQELLHGKVNVVVVSHAGHSPGCYRDGCEFETQSTAIAKDDRRWFSLEDQVQHKLAYLEDSVSPSSQLILIGHSIGCYVVLQMLKHLRPGRVRKVILLFPVMERIAESRNGQTFYPFYSGLLKMLLVFFVGFVSILPYTMRRRLHSFYQRKTDSSIRPHLIEGSLHLTSAGTWYNILSMAHQKLQEVVALDASMLERHGHKCVLYYGVQDHWVPDDVYAITKERFPSCEVVQCERGCQHAFVAEEADNSYIAEFVHSRVDVEDVGGL